MKYISKSIMSGCQIFYFSKNVCIGFNLIVQSKISSTKYEYTKNIKKKKNVVFRS